MNRYFFYAFCLLVFSCKPSLLSQYNKEPLAYKKIQYKAPNNDFLITLPLDWNKQFHEFPNETIFLDFTASSRTAKDVLGYTVDIQKMKSVNKSIDLISESRFVSSLLKNLPNAQVLEQDETTLLKYKSYYYISEASLDQYGTVVVVSFIVPAQEQGQFYNLNAIVSKTEDFEDKMAVVLSILKSFTKNEP